MKKALKYILVFALCLSLVGCRDQIKEASEKTIEAVNDVKIDVPSYERYDLLMTKYVNDTKVYGVHVENGIYDKVVVEISGDSHEYDWKSLADDSYLPVIEYEDINGDDKDEAIFVMTEYVATNVLDKKCHVIDLETFEEIELPDAISFVKDNLTLKVEEGNVTFRVLDKDIETVSEDVFKPDEEAEEFTLDVKQIEEELTIGSSVDFKIANNQIHALVMILWKDQVITKDVDVAFVLDDGTMINELN